jgi:hypothetical protein
MACHASEVCLNRTMQPTHDNIHYFLPTISHMRAYTSGAYVNVLLQEANNTADALPHATHSLLGDKPFIAPYWPPRRSTGLVSRPHTIKTKPFLAQSLSQVPCNPLQNLSASVLLASQEIMIGPGVDAGQFAPVGTDMGKGSSESNHGYEPPSILCLCHKSCYLKKLPKDIVLGVLIAQSRMAPCPSQPTPQHATGLNTSLPSPCLPCYNPP